VIPTFIAFPYMLSVSRPPGKGPTAPARLQPLRLIDQQDRRSAPIKVAPAKERPLLTIQSAPLMAADAIADYLGKPKRARERE